MIGNERLALARPWPLLAMALAGGLLGADSALAKRPAEPPQPPGEWEVIILHPQDSYSSAAYGTCGGQQVGYATVSVGDDLEDHAALWSGTAESWVDLHPAGAWSSSASGIGDGQVVGEVDSRAGLWTWTGENWVCVDLHPFDPAWTRSSASSVSGGQQVGFVDRGGRVQHASLWSGTPESWVDLHPSGWAASRAYAVSGAQQVGFVEKDELIVYPNSDESPTWVPVCHASLWSGTAESWVDLHPRKSGRHSFARDVSDGQQVGYVSFGLYPDWGAWHCACMWRGSAKSWVDLHPSGYRESECRGVSHGYQAGIAWSSYHPTRWYGLTRAGVWSGAPESWVDLHDFLPAGYEISEACDIEVSSTDIWIVGWASANMSDPWSQADAVLWHKRLSE